MVTAVIACGSSLQATVWNILSGYGDAVGGLQSNAKLQGTKCMTSVMASCSSRPRKTFFLCVSVLTPCPLYFSMLFFASAIMSSSRSISLGDDNARRTSEQTSILVQSIVCLLYSYMWQPRVPATRGWGGVGGSFAVHIVVSVAIETSADVMSLRFYKSELIQYIHYNTMQYNTQYTK